MCHAIEQVKIRERGGIDLTYFDLKMMEIMIGLGLAKDVTDRYKDHPVGRPKNNRVYHIRYGGKLLKPVVDTSCDNFIITFLPVGKRNSLHKYIKSKTSKDWIQKQKRIKC